MSNTAPQYAPPEITLGEQDRVDFMVKVYQHHAVEDGAFMAFEFLLYTTRIDKPKYY